MENKLHELEKKVQEINNARIRAETRLEELRKQRDELIAQLKAQNIDPGTLADQIEKLRQQINEKLENIESQIPEDFE